MIRARASDDPLFGSAARALAPRCLIATPADGAVTRIAFRATALDAALRAALERARLVPAERGRGELELSCDAAALDHLAQRTEHPAAAAQLAALRATLHAATRAPAAPRVVGVLNVTPDSFSDGGRFLDPARALERGRQLADEGADWIDVGGESTRPGAAPVPADVELERIAPVLEALAAAVTVPLAIDTSKAVVARRAIELGARMVNDVSAGTADPDMLASVADGGVELVLMHMRGTPRDMQRAPSYEDPVAEVLEHLRQRIAACVAAGIPRERLYVDPGIGFGKRVSDNVELVRRLGELRSLGRPIYVGVSRKSFLGKLTGETDGAGSDARLAATAAAVTACVLNGAELVRVHDVAAMRRVVRVAHALRDGCREERA